MEIHCHESKSAAPVISEAEKIPDSCSQFITSPHFKGLNNPHLIGMYGKELFHSNLIRHHLNTIRSWPQVFITGKSNQKVHFNDAPTSIHEI